MPPRLPTQADFPPSLTLTITTPPPGDRPTNILILLHGLGDTLAPFTRLASSLRLPQTACLALQAPAPLPFELGGWHWGDDVVFDRATGGLEADAGFEGVRRLVGEAVVREALVGKCGFRPREVFVWGYGQGGMAGLAAAAALGEELGGVISIGGPVPTSVPTPAAGVQKCRTPVLLLGGSGDDTLVTPAAVTRTKRVFEFVEYVKWKKRDDGMPENREEMLPIMRFFARRLRSWAGVPEGSVEVG